MKKFLFIMMSFMLIALITGCISSSTDKPAVTADTTEVKKTTPKAPWSAAIEDYKKQSIDMKTEVLDFDPELNYPEYTPKSSDLVLSRSEYINKLHGFWLGECIANWTGLVTEMDKVEPPFYTDENWGGPDHPNIWGNPGISDTIEFIFTYEGEPWKADDDTDIEYIYQHLLDVYDTSILTGEQIRAAWLHHIYSEKEVSPYGRDYKNDYENFLWVSNQEAYNLMEQEDYLVPPETSEPENNPHYSMIDAQLTTEIFGFLAPCRPDVALRMAHLPIRTTAKDEAQWISEFYVIMYSLASYVDPEMSMKDQVFFLAEMARDRLPEGSYPSLMYDFIYSRYKNNRNKNDWESTRDAVYEKYQVNKQDGYNFRDNFDGGINFAASLVSLFYGEGDLLKTMRIGTLCGWDSDNPTATWGGLLGFLLGKEGVEEAYGKDNLSETFWIHRTRRNFPDRTPDDADSEDTLPMMAQRAALIIDRVVLEEMGGGVDTENNLWYIPDNGGSY